MVMVNIPVQFGRDPHPGRSRLRRRRWLLATLALAAGGSLAWSRSNVAAPPLANGRTLDRQVLPARGAAEEEAARPSPEGSAAKGDDPAPTRVASAATRSHAGTGASDPRSDPIARAKKAIADCREKYLLIHDYTCTFVKRERIDGRLTDPHIMTLKARTRPHSLYFKFHQPNRGREAIYIHGRNNGRVVAHDVGLGKFLAGTMYLDPHGSMAMEENRHPVTEAGIGNLIDSVARHWAVELTPGESLMTFRHDARVGDQACTLIESVHPQKKPDFLFHKVKIYISHSHGLPIRFEAYDWPRHPGTAPELVEEYTYQDLKTNVGLRDHDFDPSNAQYSYGRF